MKIRKATIKDVTRIDEIYISGSFDEKKLQNKKTSKKEWIESMIKRKRVRQSSMKKDIKSPNQLWLVAEEQEVIGFGQIAINNATHAEIEKLYIDKKFRKKGIASRIEKELENWAKKKNIKKIYSRILIKNIPSIKLHEKFGFKKTAIRFDKVLN